MENGSNTTASNLIIKRRAKRKGFSMSHGAFQPHGKINRELWWFGDKEFRSVSPEKGLNDQEAMKWLDTGI